MLRRGNSLRSPAAPQRDRSRRKRSSPKLENAIRAALAEPAVPACARSLLGFKIDPGDRLMTDQFTTTGDYGLFEFLFAHMLKQLFGFHRLQDIRTTTCPRKECEPSERRASQESPVPQICAVASELGRQVAVDLKPDADFDESWSCPSHLCFPV